MDDEDFLKEWRELPHSLNVIFTCAMQVLAVVCVVGLPIAMIYFAIERFV